MIEQILLRLFWTVMLICASLVILAIWLGEPSELHGRSIATAFVVGLASFLIWAPIMVYRFYRAIARQR